MPYCLEKEYSCKDCPKPECTQKSGWEEGEFELSKVNLDLIETISKIQEKNFRRRNQKMTLNEAIKHAENVAETCGISACAEEHKQLIEWLRQLKNLTGEK